MSFSIQKFSILFVFFCFCRFVIYWKVKLTAKGELNQEAIMKVRWFFTIIIIILPTCKFCRQPAQPGYTRRCLGTLSGFLQNFQSKNVQILESSRSYMNQSDTSRALASTPRSCDPHQRYVTWLNFYRGVTKGQMDHLILKGLCRIFIRYDFHANPLRSSTIIIMLQQNIAQARKCAFPLEKLSGP